MPLMSSRSSSCPSLSGRKIAPGQRTPFRTVAGTPFPRNAGGKGQTPVSSQASSVRGPRPGTLFRPPARSQSSSASIASPRERTENRQMMPASASVSTWDESPDRQQRHEKRQDTRGLIEQSRHEMPVDGLGNPAVMSTMEPTVMARFVNGSRKRIHTCEKETLFGGSAGVATEKMPSALDYVSPRGLKSYHNCPTLISSVGEVAFNRTDVMSPRKLPEAFDELYNQGSAGHSSMELNASEIPQHRRRICLNHHSLHSEIPEVVYGRRLDYQSEIDLKRTLAPTGAGEGKAAKDGKKITPRSPVSDQVGSIVFGKQPGLDQHTPADFSQSAGKLSRDLYR